MPPLGGGMEIKMNLTAKKFKRIGFLFLVVIIFTFFMGCKTLNKEERWEDTLYTPTMVQKIDDTYFIIDCWHHRVIYNDNLVDNISKWNTLTDEIKGGHSIASDGELYLIDDTDNSMIRVFIKGDNGFSQIQVIEEVNNRPHFILYDDVTDYFYAICSTSGEVLILSNKNGKIVIVDKVVIEELSKSYTRSFNIIDGKFYTVSGNGFINIINYLDMSFDVQESYKVPDELFGMNYITKIEDYFYITSYTNLMGEISPKFVRIKDLSMLEESKYEDLYEIFGFIGTPYYINNFDNMYFITEIDASSGVKSFEVINNEIMNITELYYFDGVSLESLERKQSKYN